MDFAEKLRRLAEGKNKSDLARAASLTPTVISNYINRGSVPRADIALSIARALDVPLDWIVDDARGWPPPERTAVLQNVSDRELMKELATRYRRAVLDYLAAQEMAEKMDWAAATAQAERTPINEPLPELADRARKVSDAVSLTFERMKNEFDLAMYCALNHEALPGGDQSLSTVGAATSGGLFGDFRMREEVRRFVVAVQGRPDYQASEAAARLRKTDDDLRTFYARVREAEPPILRTKSKGNIPRIEGGRR